MVIAATAMVSSCAEDKQILGNAYATVEIIDLTPWTVSFKITTKGNGTTSGYAIITDSNNTVVTYNSYSCEAYDDNTIIIYAIGSFAPETTYNYTIFGEQKIGRLNRDELDEEIGYEISSGSFTTPSEYEKCCVMTPLITDGNSATLRIELPEGLTCSNDMPKVCYSKSPDLSDMETTECIAHDGSHFTANLNNLQSDTKYYVKLLGDYKYDFGYDHYDYNSYDIHDFYLNIEPGSFTTAADNLLRISDPIVASVVCALDSYAIIDFRLPNFWHWAGNCQVIYSTDPKFIKDVGYTENVSLNSDICTCTLTGLNPSTTYHVALSFSGDLSYPLISYEFLDVTLSVEPESFTTRPQNKVEKINGHDAVDLGLSVKWASCDIGADTPGEVGHYFTFPAKPGITDIAGTANDIATNVWGDGWAMPTRAQWDELAEKCKIYYLTEMSDNPYYLVIGPNESYIRLNCAGFLAPFDQLSHPHHLYYWTSETDEKYADGGVALSDFLDGHTVFNTLNAQNRLSVRAVTK